MRVTFIAHSGFLVELPQSLLLFDYYCKPLPPLPDKPLTVFVSHNHSDHFNPDIFTLFRTHSAPVRFILSRDVRLTDKRRAQWGVDDSLFAACTSVRPDSVYQLPGLEVQTVKSTDLGVAFVVRAEGFTVYHAGDLNWWHWTGESEAFNRSMAEHYQAAMQKLEGQVFDVAFVPVDGRQEASAVMGADELLRHVTVKRLFPMHFWEDFSQSGLYRAHCPEKAVWVAEMEHFGQSWDF